MVKSNYVSDEGMQDLKGNVGNPGTPLPIPQLETEWGVKKMLSSSRLFYLIAFGVGSQSFK